MTCHYCQVEAFKFGTTAQGFQRFRCKTCGKTFSDIRRLLGAMRIEPKRAYPVVALLCEGMGIRATERLTGLNRRTVLGILEMAGRKCQQLMDATKGLQVAEVQIDEIYGFVGCLQQNTIDANDIFRGEQYAYLAIDRKSKFILHTHVGKRDTFTSRDFLEGLKPKISGRFQLTSDGFEGYCSRHGGVGFVFGQNVDYATEIKEYGHLDGTDKMKHNPVVCTSVKRKARIGNPNMARATTNHVERTNLSVRLFNRRFTRKTMGFSRKLQNHRWSIILMAAHFNFCRVHSAHGMTPAMAIGLTDHVWTVKELMEQQHGNTP